MHREKVREMCWICRKVMRKDGRHSGSHTVGSNLICPAKLFVTPNQTRHQGNSDACRRHWDSNGSNKHTGPNWNWCLLVRLSFENLSYFLIDWYTGTNFPKNAEAYRRHKQSRQTQWPTTHSSFLACLWPNYPVILQIRPDNMKNPATKIIQINHQN